MALAINSNIVDALKMSNLTALFSVTVLLTVSAACGRASHDSFDSAYASAQSKFKEQDYSAAQEAFAAALELAPDHLQRARARNGLAECLLESKDGDGCRNLAEETLQDFYGEPDWPQAHALRLIAESYRREKRVDEMRSILDRIGIFQSKSNEIIGDFVRLGVASMLKQEGLHNEGNEQYQIVIDSGRSYRFWAMFWLARGAFESGNLDEARGRLTKLRAEMSDAETVTAAAEVREAVEGLSVRLGAE
jgi:tetratricopeptide (TPR) repeat protein